MARARCSCIPSTVHSQCCAVLPEGEDPRPPPPPPLSLAPLNTNLVDPRSALSSRNLAGSPLLLSDLDAPVQSPTQLSEFAPPTLTPARPIPVHHSHSAGSGLAGGAGGSGGPGSHSGSQGASPARGSPLRSAAREVRLQRGGMRGSPVPVVASGVTRAFHSAGRRRSHEMPAGSHSLDRPPSRQRPPQESMFLSAASMSARTGSGDVRGAASSALLDTSLEGGMGAGGPAGGGTDVDLHIGPKVPREVESQRLFAERPQSRGKEPGLALHLDDSRCPRTASRSPGEGGVPGTPDLSSPTDQQRAGTTVASGSSTGLGSALRPKQQHAGMQAPAAPVEEVGASSGGSACLSLEEHLARRRQASATRRRNRGAPGDFAAAGPSTPAPAPFGYSRFSDPFQHALRPGFAERVEAPSTAPIRRKGAHALRATVVSDVAQGGFTPRALETPGREIVHASDQTVASFWDGTGPQAASRRDEDGVQEWPAVPPGSSLSADTKNRASPAEMVVGPSRRAVGACKQGSAISGCGAVGRNVITCLHQDASASMSTARSTADLRIESMASSPRGCACEPWTWSDHEPAASMRNQRGQRSLMQSQYLDGSSALPARSAASSSGRRHKRRPAGSASTRTSEHPRDKPATRVNQTPHRRTNGGDEAAPPPLAFSSSLDPSFLAMFAQVGMPTCAACATASPSSAAGPHAA
mmetsp:Transcript_17154/g.53046  ORF Transcript_17154/g.53046 Transcript_17154/m.53046 type:complete len:697 (-) Transcript_17154:296-2386(-)